jgi:hypothetical protein
VGTSALDIEFEISEVEQLNGSALGLLSAPGIQLRRLRNRASRIVQNRHLMVRVCAGALFRHVFLDVEVAYAAEFN